MCEQVRAGRASTTLTPDQREVTAVLSFSVCPSVTQRFNLHLCLCVWVHLSPLYLKLLPLLTLHRPLSFILFFSHCLFFCPRLNSLTHSSESSPSPPPPHPNLPPHWGCHGDHRALGWVGWGALCECVSVYSSASGKYVTSRTEVRTCDLPPQHSYLGHSHTLLSFLCIIQPTSKFPWIWWYSLNCCINILMCVLYVCVPRLVRDLWSCSRGLQTSRPSQQNSIVSSHISPGHR